MCEHPQIVRMKIPAFGGEVQINYQVPCWCCEGCLKDKEKIFYKWDKKRYKVEKHSKKKEVKDEKA